MCEYNIVVLYSAVNGKIIKGVVYYICAVNTQSYNLYNLYHTLLTTLMSAP